MKRDRSGLRPFGGGSAALVFKKPSLRTRASFDVGVHELGVDVIREVVVVDRGGINAVLV